jgi:acetyl-CoA acetyltransferase
MTAERDAYIAGVGIHEFGRFDKQFEQIGKEAVVEALEDASMTVDDLDIGFCSNIYQPSSSGMRVMSEIGRTGIPVTDVDAACAAGVTALSMARSLVESRSVDVALAFGVEKMPRGFMDPTNGYPDWMCHMGLSQNPQYWAMAAKRHMHDHGTTPEQLAEVSVKNHVNGAKNPNAYYREEMDQEEVMGSKLVCDPLHLYEICVPDDGAAAVVVTSEDIVEDRGITDAVKILTSTHRTSKFPSPRAGTYCATPTGNPTATELTAEAAYADAGITPEDISLAEVQDTNAFEEIRWYEQLGFCETGQGGEFIESGAPYPDGDLPVNVSGGLISKGEPPGASHLGQVHELTMQLRGEAGERQVEDPTIGLGHVVGGMGQCGITILSNE